MKDFKQNKRQAWFKRRYSVYTQDIIFVGWVILTAILFIVLLLGIMRAIDISVLYTN